MPYSEKPEWKDVTPVPQEDGPMPLAVIRYPPGFEEVHSYFRAIQQRSELSARALQLTADVIQHNSANYTAWYYRRRCLKELDSDLEEEMEFTNKWARDCPKNYQVWYHRRWLISEKAQRLRERLDGSEAEQQVRAMAEAELEYHQDVMQINDDFKNYNGWSHRQFITSKFNVWDNELKVVEDLLRDDVRNNSAWNHRYTVLKNTSWPFTDDVRSREVNFTLKALRSCANNESAWNYLSAYFGEGEGKVSWSSAAAVEALCHEVLAQEPSQERICRFAVETLARILEARGEFVAAMEKLQALKTIDKMREQYWDWRAQCLQTKCLQ